MTISLPRLLRAVGAMGCIALAAAACANRETDSVETVRSALGTSNVLTRNYDNTRSGANLNEPNLNTANVASLTFGELFTMPVDDEVYAGVLYASSVPIGGVTHNVLYVATVNNTVYAFDADIGGAPLWPPVNFNNGNVPPFHSTVIGSCGGTYVDFDGNIGIVGTPVIDANTLKMYFVTRTVESGTYRQWFRAIDITTGAELGHTLIPTIDARYNNQRAALTLSQGKVYVAWSSQCDQGPYHGRMLAFDANTLLPTSFNFDAGFTKGRAGIWMAGAGPVVDGSGNLFFATGNSDVDASDYSQSIVKIDASLISAIGFRPTAYIRHDDEDFGSAGPITIPGTNWIVMGGKLGGICYIVNMVDLSTLPEWQCVDSSARPSNTHHLHNSMVAWQSPAGINLYDWGENDYGRAWRFNGSGVNTPAVSVTTVIPPVGMPGGMMTLSASGSAAASGILWASMPLSGDANHSTVPGVLRAFNAENLGQELWNSTFNPADNPGNFSKGSIPIAANGKVYLASLSHVVTAYGPRFSPELIMAVTQPPLF
jgi:hypothetical protein